LKTLDIQDVARDQNGLARVPGQVITDFSCTSRETHDSKPVTSTVFMASCH